MDTILGEAAQKLSEVAGYSLLPTYTYTRLYGKGDELVIHRDRPSCELSGTLALGIPDGEEINPIYFSKNFIYNWNPIHFPTSWVTIKLSCF